MAWLSTTSARGWCQALALSGLLLSPGCGHAPPAETAPPEGTAAEKNVPAQVTKVEHLEKILLSGGKEARIGNARIVWGGFRRENDPPKGASKRIRWLLDDVEIQLRLPDKPQTLRAKQAEIYHVSANKESRLMFDLTNVDGLAVDSEGQPQVFHCDSLPLPFPLKANGDDREENGAGKKGNFR